MCTSLAVTFPYKGLFGSLSYQNVSSSMAGTKGPLFFGGRGIVNKCGINAFQC